MAQPPRIRRYALVPNGVDKGVRRFRLARVESSPRADRLARMEEVAARERRDGEAPYESQPGVD